RTLLIAGGAAAIAKCGLLMITTLIQREARDYRPIAARLTELMTQPGAAAIDQRAWLALRAHDPARELHQVMPAHAAAQVRIFESDLLRETYGAARLRYV